MNNVSSLRVTDAGNGTQYSRMLVDLDTIFDTRMATLAIMGQEHLKSALSGNYHDRTSDNFKGVDYDTFKEFYAKRDKSYLKYAVMTPVVKLAHDFAMTTMDNVNNSPFHYKPVIMLNVYPYVLSEQEIGVLTKAMAAATKGIADIEIVNMTYQELTPLYLKLNLSIMTVYEYDKWFEVHSVSDAWMKYTAPDVTVLAPRISMVKEQKSPELMEEAFETFQDVARPFVDFKFLSSELFSCALHKSDFDAVRK